MVREHHDRKLPPGKMGFTRARLLGRDFVGRLSQRSGLSPVAVAKLLKSFVAEIQSSLKKDGVTVVPTLGWFWLEGPLKRLGAPGKGSSGPNGGRRDKAVENWLCHFKFNRHFGRFAVPDFGDYERDPSWKPMSNEMWAEVCAARQRAAATKV
jgi:hypothetical protein